MADLRQSTSQVIRFGPFLDSTDFVTPETSLTITQADMRLSKDGGSFGQKNAIGNAVHDSNGWYSTTLNTTDTNNTGILEFQINIAGAVPVSKTFKVITQSAYDSLNTGTFNNFDFASDFVQVGTNNDKTGYQISGALNTLDDLENLSQSEIVTSGPIQTAVGVVVNVGIVQNLNTIDDNAIKATTIEANALDGKGDWSTVVSIFAGGDIDGFSLEEAQKLVLASQVGKTSGMETTSVTIRAADDSKDRITATVDNFGNRSGVTTDVTG